MQQQQHQPTGCFKCGRPGHWSKDCPVSLPSTDGSAPQSNALKTGALNTGTSKAGASKYRQPAVSGTPTGPRKRPNLTPDLLLSNDGLGYILEHFPRLVSIRGRGHEIDDLTKLLEAYTSWHTRLLPYFPFDQFVDKVEKLGATRRVRVCVRELREKIQSREESQGKADCERAGDAELHPNVLPEDSQQGAETAAEDTPDPAEMGEPYPDDVEYEILEEFWREAPNKGG